MVAVEARKRVYGVRGEQAGYPETGYTLGRVLQQLVPDMRANAKQAANFLEAGNEFAETIRLFLISAGMGTPTAVALDPNRVRGRGGDKAIQGQARAQLYCDALREIDRINLQLVKCWMPKAHQVVWDVCVCQRDETMLPLTPAELGVLREGLNAIYRLMPHVAARKAA